MSEKEIKKVTPAEAEKLLKEKVKAAAALYEQDKEKNDLQLGVAFYQLAKFYASLIRCDRIQVKPIQLDEKGQKIFKTCEMIYNDAIRCTLENGKAGKGAYVDFHAACMYDFMLLYAGAGRFADAVKHGENGIRLEKAIYEKMDDIKHCYRLGERMSGLAAVYAANNELVKCMETLEDSIFALEEHEEEDPVNIGILLGRSYISLASTYDRIPEEAEQTEEFYQKGYHKVEEVQELTQNRFLDDMIHAGIMVGEYYKRKENPQAKIYFKEALDLAQGFKEKTGHAKYDYIIAKLKVQVH